MSKLLFDEHISFRVVKSLHDIFPEAKHVHFFNLQNETDEKIWNFALKKGYCVITKDDDFHQRSIVLGAPPKVVWLKSGNLNSKSLESFIRERAIEILKFIQEESESLLILTRNTKQADELNGI